MDNSVSYSVKYAFIFNKAVASWSLNTQFYRSKADCRLSLFHMLHSLDESTDLLYGVCGKLESTTSKMNLSISITLSTLGLKLTRWLFISLQNKTLRQMFHNPQLLQRSEKFLPWFTTRACVTKMKHSRQHQTVQQMTRVIAGMAKRGTVKTTTGQDGASFPASPFLGFQSIRTDFSLLAHSPGSSGIFWGLTGEL